MPIVSTVTLISVFAMRVHPVTLTKSVELKRKVAVQHLVVSTLNVGQVLAVLIAFVHLDSKETLT